MRAILALTLITLCVAVHTDLAGSATVFPRRLRRIVEQPGPFQLFYNVTALNPKGQKFSVLIVDQTNWNKSETGENWVYNTELDVTKEPFSTVNFTGDFFKYGFRDLQSETGVRWSVCFWTAGPSQLNVGFQVKVAPVAVASASTFGFSLLAILALLFL
eukprot:TRINITY_DN81_c0_g1_i1.p1 TRINITY_DN81_c0_g1~~TRINITY_DN81_c0_g1_i1.p1  ORF type:complete len:159 (+),score=44.37 TRINITY_DN81_c0_g1_i1:120-596(+)